MAYNILIVLSTALCLGESTFLTVSSKALRNTDLDDIYKTKNMLWGDKQLSRTRCLASCLKNTNCRSFAYNSVNQRCQHFNMDFRGQNVNESEIAEGTFHYDLVDDSGLHGPFANAPAADCDEVQDQGYTYSGVYTITIGDVQKQVWCDLQTDGGRWTVIQRRKDGSVNFDVGWNEYKKGFGIASKEYWIGNDALHALTSNGTADLLFLMETWSGVWVQAKYSSFNVSDESDKYRLSVSGFTGTPGLGNSFKNNHDKQFSTKDQDNDLFSGSCNPAYHTGGWWYGSCTYSALNGLYYDSPLIDAKSCHWNGVTFQRESLKTVFMMIRKH